ncbi:hypothetical protein KEM60_02036 [Austwickia sp. TVS 96-490-7B]|uniref:hypothetical protein n=1 Tax=Austwickia sp. TVS 96-490-7B TaxID=2830843 RepID=UPI001C5625B2|nr:hypothetical protein [Austwickia sp. TVS 96-490-7B]MBW3085825.1 hypothetical protein [Austwickia sp. TVS 96-490-7B]
MSDIRANGSAVNPFERPGPQGVSTEAEKAMKALSLGRVGEFNFNPQDFEATYKRLYAVHKKLRDEISKINSDAIKYEKTKKDCMIVEIEQFRTALFEKRTELAAALNALDRKVCSFLNAMNSAYQNYINEESVQNSRFLKMDPK